jgi:hypothetical protein
VAVVVGIDEAGLGPLLGPLVVSAVVLEVPDELMGRCLWKALAPAVARAPRRDGRAVAIADSKRLYQGLRGQVGLEHLERGVLSSLGTAGWAPASLRRLLDLTGAPVLPAMDAYPWYRGEDVALPSCVGAGDVRAAGLRLGRRMEKVGVRVVAVYTEPLFEAEFNALIAEHDSKSELLFALNARLLRRVLARVPGAMLLVHVDRHGGRKRYLAGLQAVFPGRWIWALSESETTSSYRVEDGERSIELHFTVRCEEVQLPVALASMVSKYVRELCMKLVNRFWVARIPDLAPTAGYFGDGARFLEQIQPAATALGFDAGRLQRYR